jgi:TRAP-type mannitol/chloroaromatic compound transport system substrate-binding protein
VRRSAAAALAALALLAGCGGTPQSAGAPAPAAGAGRTWTLVSTAPRGLPGPWSGIERFARDVERASGGRLRIRLRGAGEVVGAFEVFDAVAQGRAQLGHGAAYYWRGKIPEAMFFGGVPFGMTAQEMNGWLYHGGGLALWRELYAPFGLVPFPGGNSGMQMGGWFREELAGPEDLRGLHMRIQGLGADVFERLGGVAVSLPASEVFTALESGLIDATEWVGPYNDLAFGLHQAAHFYYAPGWQEPGPPLELLVNAEAWAALPADLRAVIEAAARALNDTMLAEYTARSPAALRRLVDVHGVALRPFPAGILAALRRESDAVVDALGASSPQASRIHESYRAFQAAVTAWHDVSERAYLDAREATASPPP